MIAPFALLGAIEMGLQLVGVYESERAPFIELESQPDFSAFNPDYAARYFDGFVPSVAFNPFLTDKADGSFRVVVVGGSSTAGFPYQYYYGFPESLTRRLAAEAPEQRIEMINLGMTAVNSYTIWDLRKDIYRLNPDALLIYAGHNEFYGAFGAGSTLYVLGNRIWLKRLVLRLKRTVLFSFLEKMLSGGGPGGQPPGTADDRTLMARVVRDAAIEFQDDTYRDGIRQFESNMDEFVRGAVKRNIPVFFGTVVSNLSGQSPLGTNPIASDNFAKATALLTSQPERADSLFRLARDQDNIRFRASSDINSIIEKLASAQGVTFVDIRAAFRNASQSGVPGYDLFVDHLHPSEHGYDLIGRAFFEHVKSIPSLSRNPGSWSYGSKLDPIDASNASLLIQRLLYDYPFAKDRSPEEISTHSDNLIRAALTSGRLSDSLAAVSVSSQAPIQEILYSGLQQSQARGDTSAVLAYYEALFHWQPFNDGFRQAGVSFALNHPKFDSLTVRLAALGVRNSQNVFYWNALSALLLRLNNLEGADRAMSIAERIDSESSVMLFNRARYFVVTGDTASARVYFERYQKNR